MWLRGKEAPRVYTHTSVNQGVLLAIKYMIRRVLYLCHTMTDRHTCLLTLAQSLLVCISYLVLQSVKCFPLFVQPSCRKILNEMLLCWAAL
jgi:hypothetical protein